MSPIIFFSFLSSHPPLLLFPPSFLSLLSLHSVPPFTPFLSLIVHCLPALSSFFPSFPSIPSLYFLPFFPFTSPSSWIVTRLGGFFIKRRLDSSSGKDVLYRKCLHEVIQLIIKWVWLAGHVTRGPSCTISAVWVCWCVPILLHVFHIRPNLLVYSTVKPHQTDTPQQQTPMI